MSFPFTSGAGCPRAHGRFAAFSMCARRRRLLSASLALLFLLMFVDSSVHSAEFSYQDSLRTETVLVFPTPSPLASNTGANYNVSNSIEAAEYEDGSIYAPKETCVSRSFMFQYVPRSPSAPRLSPLLLRATKKAISSN